MATALRGHAKHAGQHAHARPWAWHPAIPCDIDIRGRAPNLSSMLYGLAIIVVRSRLLLIWLAGCFLLLACGCTQRPDVNRSAATAAGSGQTAVADGGNAARQADARPQAQAIELVIDYGDGSEKHFTGIAWKDSMTVFDVLRTAEKRPHGISVTSRGSGETLIVSKIDDLANQGGGKTDKNWIFHVNGQMGDESAGIATVRPGDRVLWKFGPYE
jgi:Domain of unknown function (DUF4430)